MEAKVIGALGKRVVSYEGRVYFLVRWAQPGSLFGPHFFDTIQLAFAGPKIHLSRKPGYQIHKGQVHGS